MEERHGIVEGGTGVMSLQTYAKNTKTREEDRRDYTASLSGEGTTAADLWLSTQLLVLGRTAQPLLPAI